MVETFASWLRRKYLEWQSDQDALASQVAFAKHLRVKHQSLNKWLNGKGVPEGENVLHLADKYGGEVYQALNIDPPERDIWFRMILEAWNVVPDAVKEKTAKQLKEQAGKYGAPKGSG